MKFFLITSLLFLSTATLYAFQIEDENTFVVFFDSENKVKTDDLVSYRTDESPKHLDAEEENSRVQFEDFKMRHRKFYGTAEEHNYRYEVFKKNLKKIKTLNDHEQGSATYGVTLFADLTEEEFRKQHLGFHPNKQAQPADEPADIPNIQIPDNYDWRAYNVVTEVKNQETCGSCWAFSTTGNVEGQWAIKKKSLVSLSEQELVDCDKLDEGCNGGLPTNAYKEIIRLGGLETETQYPYDGENEKCQYKPSDAKVYINSSVTLPQNETAMAAWLVKNGPISIGLNANAMQFYFGGISHPWKFLCSPNSLDHGVLIVGYGVHEYRLFNKKIPFWIIKNSWGKSWGEQGYYRLYRGDNSCGVNQMATSAIVN